jgi:hypothetical protein
MNQDLKVLAGICMLLATSGIFGNQLCNAVAAQPLPALIVAPTSSSAASLGQTIHVQVNVFLVFDLTGYQFLLTFNTTLLQCLSASVGSFFPGPPNSVSTIAVNNNQGIISVQATLQGSASPVSGMGVLLSVNFNATCALQYPQPGGVCTLAIVNDALYGIGSQLIQHNVDNGTYAAPYIPPQLGLTLNTDRNNYYFEDRVDVGGSLTGNGYPIPNALVGLEIDAPNGNPVVARTLQTPNSPVSCPLQITGITPCDSGGNPQSSFEVGSIAYFDVSVTSSSSTSVNGLVLVNPYDSSNASLGVASASFAVAAEQSTYVIVGLPLHSDSNANLATAAASGIATVYASVWTDFIDDGGVPLSLESQAVFTIYGTAQGYPFFTGASPQGTYEANLIVHFSAGTYSEDHLPLYKISVAGEFMGISIAQSKQIQISIAGDINMDGKVNLEDLVLLTNAYGSKPGDPNWNPAADMNGEGKVDLADLVLLVENYGKGTS